MYICLQEILFINTVMPFCVSIFHPEHYTMYICLQDILFICIFVLLALLNFMGLYLAPRLEKGYHRIWEATLQPLGPMLQHLLIS